MLVCVCLWILRGIKGQFDFLGTQKARMDMIGPWDPLALEAIFLSTAIFDLTIMTIPTLKSFDIE